MRLSRTISRKCSSLEATKRVVLGILTPRHLAGSWIAIPRFIAARAFHRDAGSERRDGYRRQLEKAREARVLVAADPHAYRVGNAGGTARAVAAGKGRQAPVRI